MKHNRRNTQIINEEVLVSQDEELVSTTDLRGVITYANDEFCKIAGYEETELVGKNHNIVRHPDMPAPAFKDLWDHLKQGNSWRGMVKNRCKDGRFYWVDAYVTPIVENNKIIGYQSVRIKPNEEMKQKAERLYAEINKGNSSVIKEQSAKQRFGLALLNVVIFFTLLWYLFGATPAVLFITALAIFIAIYKNELISSPKLSTALQQEFDSVSRLVYSGKGTHSVPHFHIGLAKAKSRTILGRFVDLSKNLQVIGHNLSSASSDALGNSEQQKFELTQVATAMNEMATTSVDIARNAAETLSIVEQTTEKCHEMHQQIDKNDHGINLLADNVSSTASSADQLQQEIDKVNGMMQEINGIAEQTNLLALNAAIEAARAGEQGRGFAVVADEVRSLSTRTQNSSEEIQSSISTMVKTVESWHRLIEQNIAQAKSCIEITQTSKSLMTNVNHLMDEVNDHSAQIATAAEEQGVVAEEINKNVQSANTLAELTYDNAKSVGDKASEIKESLDYVEIITKAFKG